LCRRRALLAYFDEAFDGQAGPCCDICTDPPELFDCTIPTQMLLSCIKRTGERFGMAYVIDILRGSQGERILRLGHDKLSTFGIGRDRPKEEWQQIARQLLQQRYIQQEGEYHVLTVTDRGHAVLFQSEPVFLTPVAVRAQRRAPVPQVEANPALFEQLRSLRKRLADERELPPYVIFHDSALREMAARLPARREDFLAIAGVGEHKADAYGDPFLACIAAYVRDTGAKPIAPPASPGPGAFRLPITGLGASARLTLKLFNEGQSVLEIATARGLAISTVEDHLVEAVETGELLDIDRLVSRERQGIIRAATAEVGSPPLLKPIRERLGDDYSYFEIRLVRPMVRRTFD
jgi:ATP-dependent DNA helicase RecQ